MADSEESRGFMNNIDDGNDDEDELIFQDFRRTGNINDLNAAGAIGDQTPTTIPSNLRTHQLDENDQDEEEDKTELLSGQRKSPPFWTFEYYQGFFDVDTNQVVRRIIGSMVPVYNKNFLLSHIRPSPDLYGPFWVCATLIFTTAISANLASYLANAGDHQWVYDFHKVTLAAAAIYSYAFLVPSGLWGILMWRKSNAGYSFLEILCVYGYSLSIYIPVSILWVVPYDWLRWILVVIGMILSGAVLMLTFWPAVEDDDRKVAAITMGVIFLLHGLLAIGFKLYFFHDLPDVAPTSTTTTAATTTLLSTTTAPSRQAGTTKNFSPQTS